MVFKKGHKSGMTGKKHSKETIEKMKKNNNSGWIKKGERRNVNTEFKKNGKSWNKNLKTGELSKKHREDISNGILKFYDKKGRVNNNLSILLRRRSMWKIWREAVFLRDNFTCQNKDCEFCNNKMGVMLHPHHKKPISIYPELAFRINNGITYCAEYHLKSGLHNNIKEALARSKKC